MFHVWLMLSSSFCCETPVAAKPLTINLKFKDVINQNPTKTDVHIHKH